MQAFRKHLVQHVAQSSVLCVSVPYSMFLKEAGRINRGTERVKFVISQKKYHFQISSKLGLWKLKDDSLPSSI